ncbi:superoxide dismutase [Streptosporangium lutulentum]|uniref:Sugar lactone lactonase YvrE n=1 Tax=Streptosporangium lutulentum TaxID=1461250 RepID=A0ABT9QM65_9ACTN|nr:superoxide dismutase [Streptosporangium lutulentum]MDP9847857.1 sugar lactone lactonase YvrE [Streptosporangium lutulentum]
MKVAVLVAGLSAVLVGAPAVAAAETGYRADVSATSTSTSVSKPAYPTQFSLPDGFQPEGIAIGPGPSAYFGSRGTGAIYRVSLRTGQGKIINSGPGTPSLGLKVDSRDRLFVAGGTGGNARVIDTRSGKVLASYQLATGTAFVNDVVLTHDAAYFTDSANPVLYKLPFGRGGALPKEAVKVPLSGDIVYTTGNNANGIALTPDRKALLVVQSNTGKLFRVNPSTGVATLVDIGTESLVNGDGLLLEGRVLLVVQNRLNTVTSVQLNRDATSGKVVRKLVDDRFDVPTTVASYRDRLYLPNARFTTTPTPTTPYNVVAVKRH